MHKYILILQIMTLFNVHYSTGMNIDCRGKGFYCIDSKSFLICVSAHPETSQTQTVNNKLSFCDDGTYCSNDLEFECQGQVGPAQASYGTEFHEITDNDNNYDSRTRENMPFHTNNNIIINNLQAMNSILTQRTEEGSNSDAKTSPTQELNGTFQHAQNNFTDNSSTVEEINRLPNTIHSLTAFDVNNHNNFVPFNGENHMMNSSTILLPVEANQNITNSNIITNFNQTEILLSTNRHDEPTNISQIKSDTQFDDVLKDLIRNLPSNHPLDYQTDNNTSLLGTVRHQETTSPEHYVISNTSYIQPILINKQVGLLGDEVNNDKFVDDAITNPQNSSQNTLFYTENNIPDSNNAISNILSAFQNNFPLVQEKLNVTRDDLVKEIVYPVILDSSNVTQLNGSYPPVGNNNNQLVYFNTGTAGTSLNDDNKNEIFTYNNNNPNIPLNHDNNGTLINNDLQVVNFREILYVNNNTNPTPNATDNLPANSDNNNTPLINSNPDVKYDISNIRQTNDQVVSSPSQYYVNDGNIIVGTGGTMNYKPQVPPHGQIFPDNRNFIFKETVFSNNPVLDNTRPTEDQAHLWGLNNNVFNSSHIEPSHIQHDVPKQQPSYPNNVNTNFNNDVKVHGEDIGGLGRSNPSIDTSHYVPLYSRNIQQKVDPINVHYYQQEPGQVINQNRNIGSPNEVETNNFMSPGTVECHVYESRPDKTTCHSYYVCRNNQLMRLFCPYNTVYSPTLQTCTTDKGHCDLGREFLCTTSGYFPDPKSCYSYYECQLTLNGYKVNKFLCPWYSFYHPQFNKCVEGDSQCVTPQNDHQQQQQVHVQRESSLDGNGNRMNVVAHQAPNVQPVQQRWIPNRIHWF